jgi:hypothetical protein
VCRLTRSGSAPKARTPITGFAGFEFTSASGARFKSTWDPRSRAPIAAATARVAPTSSAAPST